MQIDTYNITYTATALLTSPSRSKDREVLGECDLQIH